MAKKREILTLGTRIAIGGAIHGLAFGELSLGWYFDGDNVRIMMKYVWLAGESAKVNIEIVLFTLM